MSGKTKIAWCTGTWNVIAGCSKVSSGCKNCYALRMAWRLAHSSNAKIRETYKGLVRHGCEQSCNSCEHNSCGFEEPYTWTGEVRCLPEELSKPLHWKKPRCILVCSMSDLFNEKVSNGFIVDVFNVMNACPQHQFMILTKRSKRMREWYRWVSTPFIGSPNQGCLPAMCDRWEWPLPNVWIGVSVEDQPTADERISDLQATPAARRFVSLEPCLAPVIFKDEWLMSCHDCGNEGSIAYDSKPGTIAGRLCLDACEKRGNPASISLVIMGCESGPHARPMELDWARQVRDACVAAKVPYFLKQANIGGKLVKMPELDGKAWDQLPEVKHG